MTIFYPFLLHSCSSANFLVASRWYTFNPLALKKKFLLLSCIFFSHFIGENFSLRVKTTLTREASLEGTLSIPLYKVPQRLYFTLVLWSYTRPSEERSRPFEWERESEEGGGGAAEIAAKLTLGRRIRHRLERTMRRWNRANRTRVPRRIGHLNPSSRLPIDTQRRYFHSQPVYRNCMCLIDWLSAVLPFQQ